MILLLNIGPVPGMNDKRLSDPASGVRAMVTTTSHALSLPDVPASTRYCRRARPPASGMVEAMDMVVCPGRGQPAGLSSSAEGDYLVYESIIPFPDGLPLCLPGATESPI